MPKAPAPGVFAKMRRVQSTVAKNRFGDIMARVEQGEPVLISRHDRMTAVVVPADEYRRLKEASSRQLGALTEEFDAMVARMQRPGFASRMGKAFGASPKELGVAAVAALRRGRG